MSGTVTGMTFWYGQRRRRPREGDRRVDAAGVAWVCRAAVLRDAAGRVIGYDCTNGRQRYTWVREDPSNSGVSP